MHCVKTWKEIKTTHLPPLDLTNFVETGNGILAAKLGFTQFWRQNSKSCQQKENRL